MKNVKCKNGVTVEPRRMRGYDPVRREATHAFGAHIIAISLRINTILCAVFVLSHHPFTGPIVR